MTIRESIIRIVDGNPGVNNVKLVLDVMSMIGNLADFEERIYDSILNNLIKDGEVIEIEYVLEKMDYRIKSIYFPKGTKFPNMEKVA